jgi:hypothetical protein
VLWHEYEQQSSPEAHLVKDFDKLEMIIQAHEYEQDQGLALQQFFDSTSGKFKTDTVCVASGWCVGLRRVAVQFCSAGLCQVAVLLLLQFWHHCFWHLLKQPGRWLQCLAGCQHRVEVSEMLCLLGAGWLEILSIACIERPLQLCCSWNCTERTLQNAPLTASTECTGCLHACCRRAWAHELVQRRQQAAAGAAAATAAVSISAGSSGAGSAAAAAEK